MNAHFSAAFKIIYVLLCFPRNARAKLFEFCPINSNETKGNFLSLGETVLNVLESYTKDTFQTSISITLEFSMIRLCELESYGIKNFHCNLLFGQASYDSMGHIESLAENKILLVNFSESNFKLISAFNVTKLSMDTVYHLDMKCFASMTANGEAVPMPGLKLGTVSTRSSIAQPQNLIAFTSRHSYSGWTEAGRWITLEWSPIDTWGSGYNRYTEASCYELPEHCRNTCQKDFLECADCIKEVMGNRQFWTATLPVEWFYFSVTIPGGFRPYNTPIAPWVTTVACSVRGSNRLNKGPWSDPVITIMDQNNPPPRLLVAGVLGQYGAIASIDMSSTTRNDTNGNGLTVSNMDRVFFLSQFGHLLSSGMDYLSGSSLHMEPLITFWPLNSPMPIDFCINWISRSWYSITHCKHDPHRSCLYVDDGNKPETKVKTSLLHTAGPNKSFKNIACNPFADVVAATLWNEVENTTELVAYHTTSNLSSVISIRTQCLNFKSNPGDLGSSAITVDWLTNGSILFLSKNSELIALDIAYGQKCKTTTLGKLPIKQSVSVKQITADWHNIYWMNNADKVMYSRRTNMMSSHIFGSFLRRSPYLCTRRNTAPCNGLVRDQFRKISVIKAASPEMRKYIDFDVYFPKIHQINASMIGETTAKLTVSLKWNSELLSLRPRVRLVTKYKLVEALNKSNGCRHKTIEPAPCETINTTEVSRTSMLSQTITNLIHGKEYYFEVQVVTDQLPSINPVQNGTFPAIYLPPHQAEDAVKVKILGISLGAALLCMIVLLALYLCYCQKHVLPYHHISRYNQDQIRKLTKLGKGFFGEVYKCDLVVKNTCTNVAVKILREGATEEDKKNFLEEALILQDLNHPNIVKMKGICLEKPHMIVLEFIKGGSLSEYLKTIKLSSGEHFVIARHICKALVYLKARSYIHRDIRAANVLIEHEFGKKIIKKAILADFGLARDRGNQIVPYTSKMPQFPIQYSAPECWRGYFSYASDVYMFGMLLWEMYSSGETPHSEFSQNQLRFHIQFHNHQPQKPGDCPDSMYQLMQDCWARKPELRPIAESLLEELDIIKRQERMDNQKSHGVGIWMSSLIPSSLDSEEEAVPLASIDSYSDPIDDVDGFSRNRQTKEDYAKMMSVSEA